MTSYRNRMLSGVTTSLHRQRRCLRTLARELALVREEMTFFSPEDVEKILGLNAARVWNLSA